MPRCCPCRLAWPAGSSCRRCGQYQGLSDAVVVAETTYDRGVAVGRQRYGSAQEWPIRPAGADQLRPLLSPGAAATGKDPGCSDEAIVAVTTYDRGVAVGRKRN